jgi:hypothetical protein
MYGPGSPTQPGRLTREAELADPALQGTAQAPLAEDQRRGQIAQQPEGLDEDVGALVGIQAAGEDDAGNGQAGRWTGLGSHDGRDALAHPLERKAVRDHRGARAGPVGEEDVDATERLAHLGAPRPTGPEVLVVLAGDKRVARRSGARGRPPGTEDVGVDDVGGEPGTKPRGEARLRDPLGVPAIPRSGSAPCRRAELNPGRGRPAALQRRGDAMAAQLAHHAQHRELRAARLELGNDPRDQHDRTTNSRRRAVGC